VSKEGSLGGIIVDKSDDSTVVVPLNDWILDGPVLLFLFLSNYATLTRLTEEVLSSTSMVVVERESIV
jgi:hypothetical protein